MAVAAIFSGLFAMGAIDAAKPATPVQSTKDSIDILQTTAPVVSLLLFLAAIGAAWVIAISRSTF